MAGDGLDRARPGHGVPYRSDELGARYDEDGIAGRLGTVFATRTCGPECPTAAAVSPQPSVRTRLLHLWTAVIAAAGVAVLGGALFVSHPPSHQVGLPARAASLTAGAEPPFAAVPELSVPTTVPPPPPTTTTTAEVIPPARTVFIEGDSLTVGAEPWLGDALRSFHWGATGIDAAHGRKTAQGLADLAANRANLPPTVVMALGTNDLNATPADVDAWVKQARALVGNRRLIWVNLHLSDAPQFANYRALNAALAASAARYGVEVADWAGWSTAMGVRHLGDGVHYPAPGYQRRAEFYARIVAAHR